jgi:hypothetical protein
MCGPLSGQKDRGLIQVFFELIRAFCPIREMSGVGIVEERLFWEKAGDRFEDGEPPHS